MEQSSFVNINYFLRLVSVIILGSSLLFQSINVSGFTMTLSLNIVLYTRLCLFWNGRSSCLKPENCRYLDKPLHVEPFPSGVFNRWMLWWFGLAWTTPKGWFQVLSMAYASEIFVFLETMTHNTSNFYLFLTIYSLSCLMSIPTNQARLLDPLEFPHEHQLRLLCAFFHL